MNPVKKVWMLLPAFLLVPTDSTAVAPTDVKVLSGKNSIIVRQTSDANEAVSYLLKVGGKKYNFQLKGAQDYRVENLAETTHSVVLKQLPLKGKSNVVCKEKVPVYGERYESNLAQLPVQDAWNDDEVDEFTLLLPAEATKQHPHYIGTEISYTNLRRLPAHLLLKGEWMTVVTREKEVSIRNAYLPEHCADTLYTTPTTVTGRHMTLEEKWKNFELPQQIHICIDDSTLNSQVVSLYATILSGQPTAVTPSIASQPNAEGFHELQDDYSAFYYRNILRVINVLYFPDDDINVIRHLTNIVGAMTKEKDGFGGSTPAYMGRRNDTARMKINAPYLENYYQRAGFDVLKNELTGIFLHELTHAFQHHPNYRNTPSEYHPVSVEGMADAVRFTAKGFGDKERIQAGLQGEQSPQKWLTPYRISACFLMWLRNYDGDFIRKFHRSIKEIDHWTFDKAIHYVLGEQYNAEQLWELYLKDVKEEAGL